MYKCCCQDMFLKDKSSNSVPLSDTYYSHRINNLYKINILLEIPPPEQVMQEL
jgi:hypothetical protein